MPVCILGMHRSGTSMGARLLSFCGLYLGRREDLLAPDAADNPEGYFEHEDFMGLNQDLLAALGGSWSRPPELTPGWHRDPALEPLRERARALIESFSGREPWGWKDPRNCLTLPFWQDQIPGLQLVLFLRNPWEVALSLGRGGVNRDLSTQRSLDLWEQYHQVLLEAVDPERLLVSHYGAYFYDPERELARVAQALGLPSERPRVRAAAATVAHDLRRLRAPPPDEDCVGEPWDRYRELLERAGPVHAALRKDRDYAHHEAAASARALHHELSRRADRCLEIEEELAQLRVRLAEGPSG